MSTIDLVNLSSGEQRALQTWLSNEGSFMADELIYRWTQDGEGGPPYVAVLVLGSDVTFRLELSMTEGSR